MLEYALMHTLVRRAALVLLCGIVGAAGRPPAAAAAEASLQRNILRAKRKVLPALVHIKPIQEFFVGGQRKKRLTSGSGAIISRDGYVITNSHVIGKGQKIICILSDEREVPAVVVGTDPYTDLAVLLLDADTLGGPVPYARFGDSDRLEQGQFVLAMGSPFGLQQSVSAGVVSTTHRVIGDTRSIGRFNTWIQTDAAINPGNSGGPLVDLHGRIVGINTRGMVGVAENIGFSIPGNLAKEIADRLIATGWVERSTLGLSFQSIDSVRGLPLWENGTRPTGPLINAVARGGPAEAAGVRPGDIVVAINGEAADGRYDEHIPPLNKRIADLPPNTPTTLSLLRAGEPLEVIATTEPLEVFWADEFQAEDWGLTITGVTDSLVTRYQLDDTSGVHVASSAPGKPGYSAGLRPGDVVYFMDKAPVRDLEHFQELYETVREEQRERILLEVRNGSFHRFVLVKPTYKTEEAEAEDTTAEPEANMEDAPASQPGADAEPAEPDAT